MAGSGRAADEAQLHDALVRLLWQRAADAVGAPIPFDKVRSRLISESDPAGPDREPLPDPADLFASEQELLEATLTFLTSSPTPLWMGDVAEFIDLIRDACEGQPVEVRRATLRHVVRQGGQRNRGAEEIEEGFRRRLPFLAYLDHERDAAGPLVDVVCRGLEDTYVRNRSRVRHVFDATIHAAGLELSAAMFGDPEGRLAEVSEILSILVTATYEGASLRANFDPLGRGFRLPTGPGGSLEAWQLAAFATHVFSSALTTDGPTGHQPYTDLAPVETPAPGYGPGPDDTVIRAAADFLMKRMANASLRPPSFDEIRTVLTEAGFAGELDPADSWLDYRAMWGDLVSRLADATDSIVTDEWLDGLRASARTESGDPPTDGRVPAPLTEDAFSRELTEFCRVAGVVDEADSDSRRSTSNRLTLLTYLEVLDHSDQSAGRAAVERALEDCYLAMRTSSEVAYRIHVEAAGARPNPALFGDDPAGADLAYEIIALLIHSVHEGLLLRASVDPAVFAFTLPTGPGGSMQDWNLSGLAYLCIFMTCIEFVPGQGP